ncbi:hypothetical protein U3516DRAFT_861017 [Neocallimastix sp. 'constans']
MERDLATAETTCSYNVQSMYRTDCGYYGIIRAQFPWCYNTLGGSKISDCQNKDLAIKTCKIDIYQTSVPLLLLLLLEATTRRPPRTTTIRISTNTTPPIPALNCDARAGNGDNNPCFCGDFKSCFNKLDYIKTFANEDLDINTQHQLRNRLIKNDDYTYRKDVIISWERLTETPVFLFQNFMIMPMLLMIKNFYMFGSSVINHDVVQSSSLYWIYNLLKVKQEWNEGSTPHKSNNAFLKW